MRRYRIAPDNIRKLNEDEIFVFGSNIKGHHGAGAALFAKKKFGAKSGVGSGLTGQCYALPTKNEKIKTLSLDKIANHVDAFITVTTTVPEKKFLVTKIGCGLARYDVDEIAPLFTRAKNKYNIWLPKEFWEYFMLNEYIVNQ